MDASAAWTPEALAGSFVRPDAAGPLRRQIVSNTATAIIVRGNFTPRGHVAGSYVLSDHHIAADSPCHDAVVNDPGTVTEDFEGITRTAPPDIGAYEYRP